jgi:hypothetical protein
MYPEIRTGSRWIYVGKDSVSGLRHTVTDIDTVAGEVTTWSDPMPTSTSPSGFSFLGDRTAFLANFKPTCK